VLEKKFESFLHERLKQDSTIPVTDQVKIFDDKNKSGKRFIDIIPTLKSDYQRIILRLMSEFHQIPFIDLDQLAQPDREIIGLIPEKLIRHFKALPVGRAQHLLTVAMADPTDVVLVDRLGQYAKCEIAPAFASPGALDRIIDRVLGPLDDLGTAIRGAGGKGGAKPRVVGLGAKPQPARKMDVSAQSTTQTVNIVNLIIEKAVENRASDIHLEPAQETFYVRYRVDGVLHDYAPLPPKSMEASIISRLKIMANLDIAERRLPQDGRIPYKIRDKEVNLRLSTFPTIYGENVVIRVLDMGESILTLEDLGLTEDLKCKFEKMVGRTYGIILVTGPTGSGKTTTLYSVLSKINSVERNIITLEDPVEYRMDRIRQSQVDTKSGLTFARGLRSIMRQDPDVIMVGEIRDLETAQIAIQAALTGHLVLSTLHTNDAASAVTRLVDMGVEPFLISSSLLCVIAQRLARQLCPECRKASKMTEAHTKILAAEGISTDSAGKSGEQKFFIRGVGCDACKKTGYSSRVGAFEMLIPNDEIRRLIVDKRSAEVIKKEAIKGGMRTLRQDGLLKAMAGDTTFDEVLRVTQE
jgi:type IV pilus assembly protein PilB